MRGARGTVLITEISRGSASMEGDAVTEFSELVGLIVARVAGKYENVNLGGCIHPAADLQNNIKLYFKNY